MRLGDLDALSAFVSDLRSTLHKEQSTFKAMTQSEFEIKDNMYLNFQYAIDNAPTVDLKDIYQEGHYDGHLEGYTKAINEERPQGEWKFIQGATTQGSLKCPFCDYRDYHKTNSNFCPNCGAKMKGKNSSGEAYD